MLRLASLPLASLAQVWATQGVLEPLSPRGSEPEADGGVAALSWLCVLHGGGTRLCAGLGRMLARRLWQPGLEQRAVRALEQRPRAAEHPLTGGIRPAATPTERGGTWVRERRGRLIEPLGDRAHTARHAAADGAERPAPVAVRHGGVGILGMFRWVGARSCLRCIFLLLCGIGIPGRLRCSCPQLQEHAPFRLVIQQST